jgi:hypothetical protein
VKFRAVVISEQDRDTLAWIESRRELGYLGIGARGHDTVGRIRAHWDEAADSLFEVEIEELAERCK